MKMFVVFVYSSKEQQFGITNMVVDLKDFKLDELSNESVAAIEAELAKTVPTEEPESVKVKLINYKVI